MSSVNILVPDLPESVADATVATWHKKWGDSIQRDEVLVEIETDKVVLEVPASESGILDAIMEKEGATVLSRQILGRIRLGDGYVKQTSENSLKSKDCASVQSTISSAEALSKDTLSPGIRRMIAEHNLDASSIKGSGMGGRIAREDVEAHLAKDKQVNQLNDVAALQPILSNRYEKRVPMTRLRKRIAERLLGVKNSTAMLTTFNEINMQSIMDLRKKYGDDFKKRHDVRLGFISFFIKASVEALKRYPEVNASIDGANIVYHNYFDISIAVSTPLGLVTPVLHDVDAMSMSDIENKIKYLSIKGRDGKLTVDELTGGNFTITNGGVFGSLMSTPIINPPQSAILGMHAIKDRPIAVDGQIMIQPMMYVALSYDHRLIDGKESISYLLTIKNILEDPIRLLLDV